MLVGGAAGGDAGKLGGREQVVQCAVGGVADRLGLVGIGVARGLLRGPRVLGDPGGRGRRPPRRSYMAVNSTPSAREVTVGPVAFGYASMAVSSCSSHLRTALSVGCGVPQVSIGQVTGSAAAACAGRVVVTLVAVRVATTMAVTASTAVASLYFISSSLFRKCGCHPVATDSRYRLEFCSSENPARWERHVTGNAHHAPFLGGTRGPVIDPSAPQMRPVS